MNSEKSAKSTLESVLEGLTMPESKTMPEASTMLKRIKRKLLRGDAEHSERLKRIRKEIASGCRRTKGDII